MRTQTKFLELCVLALISTAMAKAQTVASVSGSGTGISVSPTTGSVVVTNTAPLTAAGLQSVLASSFSIASPNCQDQDTALYYALIMASSTDGTPICNASNSSTGLYGDGVGGLYEIDNNLPQINWQINSDGSASFLNVSAVTNTKINPSSTAAIDAGGLKVTGIANGTASYDAAAFGQLGTKQINTVSSPLSFSAGTLGFDSSTLTAVGTLTSLAVSGNGMIWGNVGIGTTVPREKLDVFGTIAAAPINDATGAAGWFIEGRTTDDESVSDMNAVGMGISVDNDVANAYSLTFGVNPAWPTEHITERMRITSSGNVGIGTTTPTQALEVAGNAKINGTASPTVPALEVGGNVKLSGTGASITFPGDGGTQTVAWNGTTFGGDYAESVDVIGDRKDYEPGDVMVIDPDSPDKFLKASAPYSTMVAGIYSTKPGLTGRRQQTITATWRTDEVPMAMMGIVPTKVSAENGAVKPGDLLVASSTIGYAMKGTDRERLTGAVIGKAMGHLDSGKGVIEVLVSLQ